MTHEGKAGLGSGCVQQGRRTADPNWGFFFCSPLWRRQSLKTQGNPQLYPSLRIVKKLLSSKARGVDEICPEMLKVLDMVDMPLQCDM